MRQDSESKKEKITQNNRSDGKDPRGAFVVKGFPETSDKRKKDFALPSNNKAETVQPVELVRPLYIIVSQVSSQNNLRMVTVKI